jgi:hypothetical protein
MRTVAKTTENVKDKKVATPAPVQKSCIYQSDHLIHEETTA